MVVNQQFRVELSPSFPCLAERYNYSTDSACPFEEICPEECRHLIAPFAIQNNTWMEIFTGSGGGGGLRGV